VLIRPRSSAPPDPNDILPPALAARIESLDVRSRRVLAGRLQGERRSKRRGRSVEFEDFRPYAPGDDLRHVDWNVYARTDRLFIKVFQEEEDLCVQLVLDASASMRAGDPSKLLAAARVLAAVGCLALSSNNRVSLSVIGLPERAREHLPALSALGTLTLPPARGRAATPRLVAMLRDVLAIPEASHLASARDSAPVSGTPNSPADRFAAALRQLAATTTGKGVVILASDLLIAPLLAPRGQSPPAFEPGYATGLKFLTQASGYDALLLHTLTPGELDPAKEMASSARAAITGDLRLLDAETAKSLELTVSTAALQAYRQRAAAFVQDAQAFCTARGIRHSLLTTDASAQDVILGPLRRAGVLG